MAIGTADHPGRLPRDDPPELNARRTQKRRAIMLAAAATAVEQMKSDATGLVQRLGYSVALCRTEWPRRDGKTASPLKSGGKGASAASQAALETLAAREDPVEWADGTGENPVTQVAEPPGPAKHQEKQNKENMIKTEEYMLESEEYVVVDLFCGAGGSSTGAGESH